MARRPRRRAQPVAITKDQTAEIIFTSGATAEPKGVIITHRNILANIVPVENEVKKYLRYARPFAPIRFLNLLPLSHMFGQAMATFIPPMLPGVVVFMRGFTPNEILRQIRTRRISVLVSVPQILEILRTHLIQMFPELRQLQASQRPLAAPLVALSQSASPVRLEVLELYRRRGALAGGSGSVLLRTRISRDPGLRAHRNRAHRDAESSLPRSPGKRRQAHRRRGSEDRSRTAKSWCAATT